MELGDKVVMNRDSEGFQKLLSFMEVFQRDIDDSWWVELEAMEPLTVVSSKETDDGLELELVDTPYRVMAEWVEEIK